MVTFGIHPTFEFVASKLRYANIRFQVVSNWGLGLSLKYSHNAVTVLYPECVICVLGRTNLGTNFVIFLSQNAGKGVSELQNFKISWGSMLPDPPSTGSLMQSIQPMFLVATYGLAGTNSTNSATNSTDNPGMNVARS